MVLLSSDTIINGTVVTSAGRRPVARSGSVPPDSLLYGGVSDHHRCRHCHVCWLIDWRAGCDMGLQIRLFNGFTGVTVCISAAGPMACPFDAACRSSCALMQQAGTTRTTVALRSR